jgi:hypothetical protein
MAATPIRTIKPSPCKTNGNATTASLSQHHERQTKAAGSGGRAWLRCGNDVKLAALAEENSMSSTPKIAVITAASIGMVLTQSSSLLAEKQEPQKVAKIAAPIDLDEEVLYSPLPDEALERAAGFGGPGVCVTATCAQGQICNGQAVKKPPYSKPPYSSNSRK